MAYVETISVIERFGKITSVHLLARLLIFNFTGMGRGWERLRSALAIERGKCSLDDDCVSNEPTSSVIPRRIVTSEALSCNVEHTLPDGTSIFLRCRMKIDKTC